MEYKIIAFIALLFAGCCNNKKEAHDLPIGIKTYFNKISEDILMYDTVCVLRLSQQMCETCIPEVDNYKELILKKINKKYLVVICPSNFHDYDSLKYIGVQIISDTANYSSQYDFPKSACDLYIISSDNFNWFTYKEQGRTLSSLKKMNLLFKN